MLSLVGTGDVNRHEKFPSNNDDDTCECSRKEAMVLLEVDLAGVIGVERPKDVRAERFGLSIREELSIDLDELLLG